jgi:gamma-glutamyl:cysteine ligase YbdK (ATP-grasp superfamily)
MNTNKIGTFLAHLGQLYDDLDLYLRFEVRVMDVVVVIAGVFTVVATMRAIVHAMAAAEDAEQN